MAAEQQSGMSDPDRFKFVAKEVAEQQSGMSDPNRFKFVAMEVEVEVVQMEAAKAVQPQRRWNLEGAWTMMVNSGPVMTWITTAWSGAHAAMFHITHNVLPPLWVLHYYPIWMVPQDMIPAQEIHVELVSGLIMSSARSLFAVQRAILHLEGQPAHIEAEWQECLLDCFCWFFHVSIVKWANTDLLFSAQHESKVRLQAENIRYVLDCGDVQQPSLDIDAQALLGRVCSQGTRALRQNGTFRQVKQRWKDELLEVNQLRSLETNLIDLLELLDGSEMYWIRSASSMLPDQITCLFPPKAKAPSLIQKWLEYSTRIFLRRQS